MFSGNQLKTNLVVLALILLGISTRFFIDIPNLTALGAIALFSGAYFTNKKLSIIVPLIIMFISDIFLGFHNTMPFVYLPIILIILLGFFIRNNKKIYYIIPLSIAGSILFYLISNFGVWITGMGYSNNLLQVYIDGLPFFRNMLTGDLFFNLSLFGISYLIIEKLSIFAVSNEK